MIRVLYMSDLHIEMERRCGWLPLVRPARQTLYVPPLRGVAPPDLVVLAGDIHNGLLSVAYADRLAKHFSVPVVLVAGNHEYYFHDLDLMRPRLAEAAAATGGRVRFLENERFDFEVRGKRLHVLGCTLWTDFALNRDVALSSAIAGEQLNDFRFIDAGRARLTPRLTVERHFASRAWLHTQLERLQAEGSRALRLIVTHHAPGPAFLGARQGAIAPAYASELLPEFAASAAPAFWVHGHTHYRHETFNSGLWVVSAPRGYARESGKEAPPYQPGIMDL